MAYSTRGVRVRVRFLSGLATLVAATLAGCGGGGVSIGDGQGADPVVLDVPIVYVQRPLPADDNGQPLDSDARELRTFNIGADLYVRDRASPSTASRNVTGALTQGLYDIRDVEPAFDGSRVVFAMRGPFIEGADEEDQPTWNIWEYELATDTLRRVIVSDVTAEAGHDVAPHYLPDGRIIFSSTRQRQSGAILVDEGKPQFPGLDEDFREPAFVLHVMDADGANIRQVSFNQSHDLDPTVIDTGEVVFTRWDNAGGVNEMSLYRMNPDGTGLQLHYGKKSHGTGTAGATVQFLQPRQLTDGRILALLRPFTSEVNGGDLIAIDAAQYVDNTQALVPNTGVLTGPAQTPATVNAVTTDGSISVNGVYGGAFPLKDGTGRLLVSWSQCRVLESTLPRPCTEDRLAVPGVQAAPPIFGIWIYDPAGNTQLPVVPPQEGVVFSEIVALEALPPPPVIPDKATTGELDPDLLAEGVGLLEVRSVYDFDGVANTDIAVMADPSLTLAAARPARFLRIEKAVSIPDDEVRDFDNAAFGVSAGQGMREILGYTMIEPDGSVAVKVPADVAFAITVLDENGRRIFNRHQNWMQVRAGEVRTCSGCHLASSPLSHGRAGAFVSAWPGAALDGQPFPNATPAIFADMGETMAEARARISCATDCAAITPSVDVRYDDVWTDLVASSRAPDASFAFRYADLTTPVPTTPACQAAWGPGCRIMINYETHVHPLWAVDRRVFDINNALVADNTCTTCHNVVDANSAAQVPEAQLDLSNGTSDLRPEYFKSYVELLLTDNEQELNGGALQDRFVEIGIDPVTGDPILAPVPVAPVLSAGGANASLGFFQLFDAGGSHAGRLTPAELRLVSEWLDPGAQYYNNPFDAPLN